MRGQFKDTWPKVKTNKNAQLPAWLTPTTSWAFYHKMCMKLMLLLKLLMPLAAFEPLTLKSGWLMTFFRRKRFVRVESLSAAPFTRARRTSSSTSASAAIFPLTQSKAADVGHRRFERRSTVWRESFLCAASTSMETKKCRRNSSQKMLSRVGKSPNLGSWCRSQVANDAIASRYSVI